MPNQIQVPGQGIIEFPDEMSDDEIQKVIREQFFNQPQEIITKRDQATVRKAHRELNKQRLAKQAEQQHQQDVQNYLGGGTVEKAYNEMSGQFYGTFADMLSGVDRLARKAMGDDVVDSIQSSPLSMSTPLGQVLIGAGLGKELKKHSNAAQTVSAHMEGNETVAKLAGVAGQVGAFIPLAVTGPAAPFLTVGGAGLQSFDSTYDDSFESYKRMGFSDDEADKAAFRVSTGAGLVTGTVTGMFNKYGGKFFGGVFGKGVERGFAKPVIASALEQARRGTFKNVAKNIMKEVTGEATEESIDQLLQVSLSYMTYRPELTLTDAMWEVMEAGLLGGFGGGLGGGTFSTYEDLKGRKARSDQAHKVEQLDMIKRSRERYDEACTA